MGYRKIQNLYKNTTILQFKECYALEKVHGTSAHIKWAKESKVTFFSGGSKHESFVALFDATDLFNRFYDLGHDEVTIYGEAYGGKLQGMRETYGDDLRFIAFEVKVDETWLNVPNAEDVVGKLGLEFVPYTRTTCKLSEIDYLRDRPSEVALRRGCGKDKMREGVVLRSLEEMRDARGNRVIIKHKRDEFKETRTPRKVDPENLQKIKDAQEAADEWVTDMRMRHVLDKMENPNDISAVGDVIKAMIVDIKEESGGELVWSRDVSRSIARATAGMFKKRISKI